MVGGTKGAMVMSMSVNDYERAYTTVVGAGAADAGGEAGAAVTIVVGPNRTVCLLYA
jgi:hypothetical protein